MNVWTEFLQRRTGATFCQQPCPFARGLAPRCGPGGIAQEEEARHMHAYVLLDRSGSMQSLWVEALSSVNAYAKGLADNKDGHSVDSHITLAVFDGNDGLSFDVLRRNQPALHWEKVTDKEATPRGMTPLLDALGRIIFLAEADKPDKAVIVVMTDGQENASRELTREGAKAALDRVKAKGWEVVFLGANFDNISDAETVGVARAKQMAMAPGAMGASMARMAEKSRAYAASAAPMEFDEEDRKVAQEAKVKNTTKKH
jgi:hypothetical protein